MGYVAASNRYDMTFYRRCGSSGLMMSTLSLGLWHNFGAESNKNEMRRMVLTSFDNGITCFDLANNYGPPEGEAESNFGAILSSDLGRYRDEIIISTKAGYKMNDSPYGNWGSRKYLLSSLDASLKRMNLEYVDIFYHHRPDPDTPLKETMGALASAVTQGKALYVGLSRYPSALLKKAKKILEDDYHIHPLINQVRYSMIDRSIENDNLFTALHETGIGSSVFSPLAQGMLTGKYLSGEIGLNTRAHENRFLKESYLTDERIDALRVLNGLAEERGETLNKMALSFVLRHKEVSTVIIGARNAEQILDNLKCTMSITEFSEEELDKINQITSVF